MEKFCSKCKNGVVAVGEIVLFLRWEINRCLYIGRVGFSREGNDAVIISKGHGI